MREIKHPQLKEKEEEVTKEKTNVIQWCGSGLDIEGLINSIFQLVLFGPKKYDPTWPKPICVVYKLDLTSQIDSNKRAEPEANLICYVN